MKGRTNSLKLYSCGGVLLKEKFARDSEADIEMSNLGPGIYLLRVNNETLRKIVKY